MMFHIACKCQNEETLWNKLPEVEGPVPVAVEVRRGLDRHLWAVQAHTGVSHLKGTNRQAEKKKALSIKYLAPVLVGRGLRDSSPKRLFSQGF